MLVQPRLRHNLRLLQCSISMTSGWVSLQKLRNLGVKLRGTDIYVSKDCRIYNPSNLILHNNVRIDDFTILSARGPIEIFNYVHIASHCLLSSATRINCHNFSGIASGSKLFGSSDDYGGNFLTNPTVPKDLVNVKTGDIILQDHVLLGSNTIVLPGVIFGEGTSVGAMSLISKNTEPWGVYAGVPGKRIKERNKGCLLLATKLEESLR
jgi:acetyltransferase-like isoleucine patch superfamily enzyme